MLRNQKTLCLGTNVGVEQIELVDSYEEFLAENVTVTKGETINVATLIKLNFYFVTFVCYTDGARVT